MVGVGWAGWVRWRGLARGVYQKGLRWNASYAQLVGLGVPPGDVDGWDLQGATLIGND